MTNSENPDLFNWTAPPAPKLVPEFDGADYKPERDVKRLTDQLARVFNLMKDAKWRSLGEIAAATGDPAPSISAQLRHLRKEKFGSHTVNKRYIAEGLYEYQLLVNANAKVAV